MHNEHWWMLDFGEPVRRSYDDLLVMDNSISFSMPLSDPEATSLSCGLSNGSLLQNRMKAVSSLFPAQKDRVDAHVSTWSTLLQNWSRSFLSWPAVKQSRDEVMTHA